MSPRSIDHIAGKPKPPEAIFTRAADVQIKPITWLWKPYLPLGKVVLVAGAPGHGKSQLTALFAASATRGAFEPTDVTEPGKALIIAAEDDAEDTIVPRLLAANADPRLVELLSMRQVMPDGLTVDGMIKLPGDVQVLHDRLKSGDVRIVIFDPVVSFFDREYSSYSNQDVRDVLSPLKALAAKYGTTIVAILHLNKSDAHEWAGRISESHAFQAVARGILALGPDPDDEEGEAGSKKILAVPKANLVKRAGISLRMEIRSTTVEQGDAIVETSAIHVTGSCSVAADDLLMGRDARDAYTSAREFLEDFLGDEWHLVTKLKAAASKDGHHWRTIERVRKDFCKKHKQAGTKNGSWWIALKSTPKFDKDRQAANPANGVRPPETPTPSRVGLGGLDLNTAKTDPTPLREGGGLVQDRNGAKAANLDDYKRQRDRMLGEPWEDE